MIKKLIYSIVWLANGFAITVAYSQTKQQQIIDVTDKKITPARYEINAKRADINYNSKEALTSSREFKRLDPTYYVGYLYEGAYNYTIAADEIGYKNAIAPLQKAIGLIEKDFNADLKTRTNQIGPLIKILGIHRDYDYLNDALYNSYVYSNQQQLAWTQIRHYQKFNLQDENNLESYNMLSWMVHRNRFYTSAKYPFLKNSIAENEKYASQLLDSAMQKIEKDNLLNKEFFSTFKKSKLTGVYHYKCILFSYSFNIPSAEYYFAEMKKNGYFPENNYANFCGTQAKFKQAEENYILASQNESSDKRLSEHIYFRSIIDAYKAKPKESINRLTEYVKSSGTTPGYGWYQLAISRSLLNDGQFGQAMAFANKAENFHEVHIGTTLGQTHYDFTTNVLKLMAKEQQIASITFENKKWYFSLSAIWRKITTTVERFMTQYIIINQFSNNPERDDVIYKLFSSESTISFDEVWALVKDYSTQFFIKKFTSQMASEKRPAVVKYYKLFLAKLYISENEWSKADALLASILEDKNFESDYEKQFMFRVLEAKLAILQHNKKQMDAHAIIAQMYILYPQWMPFITNAPVKMYVTINGKNTGLKKQLHDALNKANINWMAIPDAQTNTISINLDNKKDMETVSYTVTNADNKIIVPETTLAVTTIDEVTKQVLYGVYNIGNLVQQQNVGVVAKK